MRLNQGLIAGQEKYSIRVGLLGRREKEMSKCRVQLFFETCVGHGHDSKNKELLLSMHSSS